MFRYTRTLYLRDTDAAGVAYFASILSICHEAYEASLTAAAAPLADLLTQSDIAIPVIQASARFLQPLRCGDRCEVYLVPHDWQAHRFSVTYRLQLISSDAAIASGPAATALTQHYCIHPGTRQRQPLPQPLHRWYQRWTEPESGGASGEGA